MAKNHEHRDLFAGALELMILQTLQRQPMHGYALAQYIKAVSNDLLQIEEGSLAVAIQRPRAANVPREMSALDEVREHGLLGHPRVAVEQQASSRKGAHERRRNDEIA